MTTRTGGELIQHFLEACDIPSVVSPHTYPGLANGMFNMRNALMSGVPLLVINGPQDSRFFIHNPVLGAQCPAGADRDQIRL